MQLPNRWTRTIALSLLAAAALLGVARPAAAKSFQSKLQGLKEKRATTVRERGQIEAKLREVKERQRSVLSDFWASEQRLANAHDELRNVQAQWHTNERRIATVKARLEQVQDQLDTHIEALWQRLTSFYKDGASGYVDVVLGAQDFDEFVDRVTFFRAIADSDVKMKQSIEHSLAEQEALRSELEQRSRVLESLKSQIDEKSRRIEIETNRKRSLLADVRRDREAQEGAYAAVCQTQREIDAILQQNLDPGGGSSEPLAGGFVKPASGPYTSRFGYRYHPILHTQRFHDGVDIGAGYGATIRAAAAGTVIFAGWKGAYGRAVMVKHGSGYTTLYGHCSALLVGHGARVSQGQPIARVGSTGWSTGAHLHFSVYQNGKAINPLSLK